MPVGAQQALSTAYIGAQAMIPNSFPVQELPVRADSSSGYFPPASTPPFSVGISFPVSAPLKTMAANSSSSTGGAGSTSGGSSGNGNDDSSKKAPGRLTMNTVRLPLLLISMGRDPTQLTTPDEFQFLLRRGLIQVLDNQEYEKLKRALSRIDPIRQELNLLKSSHHNLNKKQEALMRKHNFWLYRLFSYIFNWGTNGLRKEVKQFDAMKNELENMRVAIHNLETALAKLRTSKEFLDRFVSTPKGYLALTKHGTNMLRLIREFKPDIEDDTTFATFESAMIRAAQKA